MTYRCVLKPHRSAVDPLALAVGCILLVALNAPGQQADIRKPLTFEVATIKPASAPNGGWRLEPTPDGYTGRNVSLLRLVGEAYGIFDAKLLTGGPPWVDQDRFDIEAKFDPAFVANAKNLTYRQRADMLRPILADRFHLKVHHETKVFPVFNLVIAKDGPKLQLTKPENIDNMGTGVTCHVLRNGDGYTKRQDCDIKSLEDLLRFATGRTVIDQTGLSSHYDFELRWTPENAPADSPLAGGPSIFTAVQGQLGLKLEPATAPLDVLVIDSAQHPSEN